MRDAGCEVGEKESGKGRVAWGIAPENGTASGGDAQWTI